MLHKVCLSCYIPEIRMNTWTSCVIQGCYRSNRVISGVYTIGVDQVYISMFYRGVMQCCARVSPGTREPDPWEKIHQNRTRNRQKIKVSSRTGTGTAKRCVSVLKPEKALKGQHLPDEINEFFGVFIRRKEVNNRSIIGIWTDTTTENWNQEKNSNKTGPEPEVNMNKF